MRDREQQLLKTLERERQRTNASYDKILEALGALEERLNQNYIHSRKELDDILAQLESMSGTKWETQ